jgi:2-dehydro-3-deoxygalactonokinase
MYIASVDCGTTNSRVYIIRNDGAVVGKGVYGVGVSDVAREKTKDVLVKGLRIAFREACEHAGLTEDSIRCVVSAGMITSELGLCEVPHLIAPVGVADMASHLVRSDIEGITDTPLPWYFIPGLKNRYEGKDTDHSQVGNLDFMRGEEVQAIGLLEENISFPATLVILSSHTKFISIDADGKIEGSLTTLSGQIYRAFVEQTSIGKSVQKTTVPEPEGYFDVSEVDNGFDWVMKAGLLRTMMMPRFLDVLMDSEWYERKLFIESAIAADDMRALSQFDSLGFNFESPVVLIGMEGRCRIYRHILKNRMQWDGEIRTVVDTEKIDTLNIHGVLKIANEANLM